MIVALPAIALIVVGLTAVGGPSAANARIVCAALGFACAVIIAAWLTSFSFGRFGPGAWITCTGGLFAAAAVTTNVLNHLLISTVGDHE